MNVGCPFSKHRQRSESQESFNGKSIPSGTAKDGPTVGSDFAGESNKMETEQARCALVCRGELYLTKCD